MHTKDSTEECCFCPDASTNANRGPTDKQLDADPLQERLRKAIEDRVGKATSAQAQMGDSMSDKPFATQQ